MQQHERLEYGQFYHIYNHGVGGRNLFRSAENYSYFLSLYEKHISEVAETFAWVLMPNHFHMLVRMKEETVVFIPDRVTNPVRDKNNVNIPSQQFSKLFNSYAQAFNKYYQTRGALFERPFRRKLVTDTGYLRQLVLYIHNNPVRHGFCDHPLEYPWSSFLSCIEGKPTMLKREAVLSWFDGKAGFEAMHQHPGSTEQIHQWITS